MSGRSTPRRRGRGGPSRSTWAVIGEAANRADGCICDPTAEMWHDDRGGRHVTYSHDLWCPMGAASDDTLIVLWGGAA